MGNRSTAIVEAGTKAMMNPMDPITRRKKLLGWQTSKSTDRKIKYLLMLICAIVVFTIGNYGEDDANDFEQPLHLLSQG